MGYVLASKEPFVINDPGNDVLVRPAGRRLNQKYGFQISALVPLLANGRSIGVLSVMDLPRNFAGSDRLHGESELDCSQMPSNGLIAAPQ
jgi:GAF domain-containing protein